MIAIFNIVIIALVLLIAYWWGNQGLFSAILHLVCVIAAGAIALSLWEPVTTRLLLRGSAFDMYAWGVSLVMLFVLSLFILRFIADKTVGANVDLPPWANLAFGLPVGAAAGVITMGIFVIGAGFIQSSTSIIGFTGASREGRSATVTEHQKMWLPVHKITYEFYSLLSVGSLHPTFNNTPLRQYYPALYKQAAALQRDSAMKGGGDTALRPSDAKVEKMIVCSACNPPRYAVAMIFEAGARDFGEMLTLSSAQVRLIGRPGNSTAEAKTAHPDRFIQYSGRHRFDDVSHYATSEPAQQRSYITFEFRSNDLGGQQPRFIQVRGTRYALPAVQQWVAMTEAELEDFGGDTALGSAAVDAGAPSIQSAVQQSISVQPVTASTNQLPAGTEITKANNTNYISGGDGDFPLRGDRPSRNLMVAGIYEPAGSRCVQVDVSRTSPANIFGSIRDQVSDAQARIILVDSDGRTYPSVGFIHNRKSENRVRINVDPDGSLASFDEIPLLPTSGDQTLKLLFYVTEGKRITGMLFGNVTVGTCDLLVRDPKARDENAPPPDFNVGAPSAPQ